MNERCVPWRFSQPLCAAYATTAGAVSERRPAITPIRNARSITSDELIRDLLAMPFGLHITTADFRGVDIGRDQQLSCWTGAGASRLWRANLSPILGF